MKFSDIKIDSTKHDNADWVDNIPEFQGVRFKVRAAENNDWRKLRQVLVDAIPRKHKVGGRLRPEDQDRLIAILLRDTSLVDWDGLENDDGTPLAYSREAADKFLTEPDFGKFREAVMYAANIVSEQYASDVEDIAKN